MIVVADEFDRTPEQATPAVDVFPPNVVGELSRPGVRRLAELGVLPRQTQKHFDGLKKLGRVPINRQPNADLDVPPNVRYWG